jgi:hypothetical protein
MIGPRRGCGLGGATLLGGEAVRIVFMDEAGVSNPREEPFTVVAGVMIEPDRRYGALDAHIRTLAEDFYGGPLTVHVLDAIRGEGHPFIFHAKDVWHGSGLFPRKSPLWPREKRMKLLAALSDIPFKFSLNIMYTAVDRRSAYERHTGVPPKMIEAGLHAYAYFETLRKIDRWMIENAPNEYTLVYAEDRVEVRRYLSLVHSLSTDRSIDENADENTFSSTHIVEPVAFLPKKSSVTLQVADHCAFIIKRRLQGCKDIGPYFEKIKPMIWNKATEAGTLHVPYYYVRQSN